MQTAEALSGVLRSNSTLREVDVASNALGVAGGQMLREALADNMYASTLVLLLAAGLNPSDACLILLCLYIVSSNTVHLICCAVAVGCRSFHGKSCCVNKLGRTWAVGWLEHKHDMSAAE